MHHSADALRLPSSTSAMSRSQRDLVIGTGGGTPARHLAPSRRRILLLERGDYAAREKRSWYSRAVNPDGAIEILREVAPP